MTITAETMSTSMSEINVAVQVSVSRLKERTTLKSTYFII